MISRDDMLDYIATIKANLPYLERFLMKQSEGNEEKNSKVEASMVAIKSTFPNWSERIKLGGGFTQGLAKEAQQLAANCLEAKHRLEEMGLK